MRALIDPAEPDFVRAWIRVLGLVAATAVLAGCAGLVLLSREPFGQYLTAVILRQAGAAERTEAMMRALIAEHPTSRYAPYALLNRALIDQDRRDEALDVLTAAAAAFPEDSRAHGHRCRQGLLLGRPAEVAESCEAAAELVPGEEVFVQRTAVVRMALGDAAGSRAAIDDLVGRCDAGVYQRQRACDAWREAQAALAAGEDPFVAGDWISRAGRR